MRVALTTQMATWQSLERVLLQFYSKELTISVLLSSGQWLWNCNLYSSPDSRIKLKEQLNDYAHFHSQINSTSGSSLIGFHSSAGSSSGSEVNCVAFIN